MTKKVIILCGLPGSGKTTKAKELERKHAKQHQRGYHSRSKYVRVWEMDYYMNRNKIDSFFKDIGLSFKNYEVHILDGLFIRQHHYQKVIDELESRNAEFEFHYFQFDIESCLWNDKYRRDIDSTLTLENALYEYPNLDKLSYKNGITKISLFEYPVELKSLCQMFMHKYNIHSSENDILRSESWTTGGNWRDCWDNGGEFGAETPPEEFSELNALLNEIDPQMSPTLIQEIKNNIIYVEDDSEADYYGGCRYFSYYAVNYLRLYEILVELKVINPEELAEEI